MLIWDLVQAKLGTNLGKSSSVQVFDEKDLTE